MMVFAVVVAFDTGIVVKTTSEECGDCFVCIAGDSTEQADISVGQRHLCAAANAAADQHIYAEGCQ